MTRRRRAPAFTLVEAIAVIVILTTIGSLSSALVFGASRSYADQTLRARLHAELSIAMDRVSREIRRIPLNAGSTALAITTLAPAQLVLDDGASVALSGGNLMFDAGPGDPAVLLSDVSQFLIRPLDAAGAGLTAEAASIPLTHRIEITISVTRQGITETLRTRIFPRSIIGIGS